MPKFLLSLLFICTTSLVWSQESQQERLEQRKAQIQQEIKENERLLTRRLGLIKTQPWNQRA